MIRTVDMQSVLTQSTSTEKVNQTQQQNQDMNMRHFALLAEEAREQKRSSVNTTGETGKVSSREQQEKRESSKKNPRDKDEERASSGGEEDEKANATGTLIDITV